MERSAGSGVLVAPSAETRKTIPATRTAGAGFMIADHTRRAACPTVGRWPPAAIGRTFFPPMSSTTTEPNKVIYSMMGVTKAYDRKVVLKDIWLSYFYGAKIGVLGLNGSGKSSLLKILAGVDKNFQGKISLAPGFTTGYLEQEPRLDETRTVRQIVEEGVADKAK